MLLWKDLIGCGCSQSRWKPVSVASIRQVTAAETLSLQTDLQVKVCMPITQSLYQDVDVIRLGGEDRQREKSCLCSFCPFHLFSNCQEPCCTLMQVNNDSHSRGAFSGPHLVFTGGGQGLCASSHRWSISRPGEQHPPWAEQPSVTMGLHPDQILSSKPTCQLTGSTVSHDAFCGATLTH